jgi:hypothetical protein
VVECLPSPEFKPKYSIPQPKKESNTERQILYGLYVESKIVKLIEAEYRMVMLGRKQMEAMVEEYKTSYVR